MPVFEPVERRREKDVDTTHDVKSIGTYNKRGVVYIDRQAVKQLSPREVREIEIHERIELTKRLEGKSYTQAHSETEALFPFTQGLKEKLHDISRRVIQHSQNNPHEYDPPKDSMMGAAVKKQGVPKLIGRRLHGGAVMSEERDDVSDAIEEEYLKRRVDGGQLRTVEIADMTDKELQEILEQRRQQKGVVQAREKFNEYRQRATDGMIVVADRVDNMAQERHEADLAGRTGGGLYKMEVGMQVMAVPKDLQCSRCGKVYKAGEKVFKKSPYGYYCPNDGAELKKPETPGKAKPTGLGFSNLLK